jgi:N-acetylglutamate synthase-like GNAT family acetyltransferase
MTQFIEIQRDQFTISTDPARLDLDAICDFFSRTHWAKDRPRERTERALANSLAFGVYESGKQIGIARVISDYATFAYIDDIFIHENYRARGLGKWLMQTIMSHPDLQGIRRWNLITRDAHGLYKQYGFSALANPAVWMEMIRPFPGEGKNS